MQKTLRIGELGKHAGTSAKTIRYYESIDLLTSAKRSENGYRMYDSSVVEELRLIRYARDLGLPIEEIRKLMKGCVGNSCSHTRKQVGAEIETYIERITRQIVQLTVLKKRLNLLKKDVTSDTTCTNDRYCCNVLYQLAHPGKGGEEK